MHKENLWHKSVKLKEYLTIISELLITWKERRKTINFLVKIIAHTVRYTIIPP